MGLRSAKMANGADVLAPNPKPRSATEKTTTATEPSTKTSRANAKPPAVRVSKPAATVALKVAPHPSYNPNFAMEKTTTATDKQTTMRLVLQGRFVVMVRVVTHVAVVNAPKDSNVSMGTVWAMLVRASNAHPTSNASQAAVSTSVRLSNVPLVCFVRVVNA